MKKLFIFAIATVLFSSSCTKEQLEETLQNSNITVGFRVGGAWVTLSIGNGGGYYYDQSAYYGYDYNVTNSVTTVGYIRALPLDETRIPIFDRNGQILGNANLPSGTGSQMNVAITQIRNWFVNGGGPLPVLVSWNQKFTNAPWDGTIVSY